MTESRESVKFIGLRSPEMLLIDTARIPPEGLDLDETLEPSALHVEGETEFLLQPGGRFRAHVELVDTTTIHVRGRLSGALQLECGRCLEPFVAVVEQELDLFYLPSGSERSEDREDEVELSDRELVVGFYDAGRLDLGGVVREQVFLSLPLKRLCRQDCRGLCRSCGKNLNAGACGCPPPDEVADPRLSALRRLIEEK